jgi:hypothetical protein
MRIHMLVYVMERLAAFNLYMWTDRPEFGSPGDRDFASGAPLRQFNSKPRIDKQQPPAKHTQSKKHKTGK